MENVMGTILLFAGDTPPEGWAFCDGSILLIEEHTSLFVILRTNYDGCDGKVTLALPDFRGRVPMGTNQIYDPGWKGGAQFYTLNLMQCGANIAVISQADQEINSNTNKAEVFSYGEDGEPFDNMQPYLGLHFIICISGRVPSRW